VFHKGFLYSFIYWTSISWNGDIATLVELLFNKSVVPGWDISKFAKNTEKNVRYRA
jgi:hypothetical protein